MPPPPPTLPDELVEEVLLRLPPDSPASLVRAGLVCKRWCHLVSDPIFHNRLREFHRSPPMLGFFYDGCDSNDAVHFVPTSASCKPHASHHRLQLLDSRHGRVLLYTIPAWPQPRSFIIWDPVTDERLELPQLSSIHCLEGRIATVLCAATLNNGACDHLDCHGGPFIVVLMGAKDDKVFSYVYSSEVGAWSKPTSAALCHDHVSSTRSVLVGTMLYFVSDYGERIIEYDLGTRKISMKKLPKYLFYVQLTTTEYGQLGFIRVEDCRLCLWSREAEDARWVRSKVIDLDRVLPHDGTWTWNNRPILVGSTEGFGVVFITVNYELFVVDLRSDRVTKVLPAQHISDGIVLPYVSFYTPVLRVPSADDGPRRSSSST